MIGNRNLRDTALQGAPDDGLPLLHAGARRYIADGPHVICAMPRATMLVATVQSRIGDSKPLAGLLADALNRHIGR